MPSDKSQYGKMQEGPALTVGDVKGKGVEYAKPSAMSPSSTAASMKKPSGNQGQWLDVRKVVGSISNGATS